MNFLIIDDQEPVIEIMKECLEDLYPGCVVKHCFKPETAIEKEISHCYDVIFVDYKFNNSDLKGKDVLEYLRKKYPRRGVIFMTAFHDESDVMEAAGLRQTGFHGFIPKDKDDSIDIASIQEPIRQKVDVILAAEKERINQIMSKPTKLDIERRLDFMEISMQYATTGHIVEDVAVGVTLLENGCPKDELEKNIREARNKSSFVYKAKNKGGIVKITMLTNSTISKNFKVYEKRGKKENEYIFIAEDITEKARQLFLINPEDRWKKIKKSHSTVVEFLKDFDIS